MPASNDITGDPIHARVLSKQGRENWDRIFPPKKTAYEWADEVGLTILDPDGWRYDNTDMNTKITNADFNARLIRSTIVGKL
jgi:hypothetical protein